MFQLWYGQLLSAVGSTTEKLIVVIIFSGLSTLFLRHSLKRRQGKATHFSPLLDIIIIMIIINYPVGKSIIQIYTFQSTDTRSHLTTTNLYDIN